VYIARPKPASHGRRAAAPGPVAGHRRQHHPHRLVRYQGSHRQCHHADGHHHAPYGTCQPVHCPARPRVREARHYSRFALATCVTLLNLHSRRNLGDSWDMSLGARLRWAARAADEPTATKGGDPSDTYKRWFGRVSGRAGWWRGSSLVGNSYWPGSHREMRAGSCHARDRVQRMDAPMQLLCG